MLNDKTIQGDDREHSLAAILGEFFLLHEILFDFLAHPPLGQRSFGTTVV
jgi:hypothetical protein